MSGPEVDESIEVLAAVDVGVHVVAGLLSLLDDRSMLGISRVLVSSHALVADVNVRTNDTPPMTAFDWSTSTSITPVATILPFLQLPFSRVQVAIAHCIQTRSRLLLNVVEPVWVAEVGDGFGVFVGVDAVSAEVGFRFAGDTQVLIADTEGFGTLAALNTEGQGEHLDLSFLQSVRDLPFEGRLEVGLQFVELGLLLR